MDKHADPTNPVLVETLEVLEEQEAPQANRLHEWVSDLYGGQKPGGVVEELIRERREEAGKE